MPTAAESETLKFEAECAEWNAKHYQSEGNVGAALTQALLAINYYKMLLLEQNRSQ